MSVIVTNYTKEDPANKDTLQGGALTSYRMLHWLKDILCNFMADPVNIKDERICKILNMQDGDTPEKLNALFDIGVAYSEQTKKACTTPMIFVSLGPRQYPVRGINVVGSDPITICNNQPASMGFKHKVINMTITIMTEKYDSTVIFTDFIEDFLLIHEDLLIQDNGMISEFHVNSVSEPQMQEIGQSAHAKVIYVQKISVSAVGGVSWTTDTQGPVFRGLTMQMNPQ
jgi:hypothetical protein